MVIEIDEATKSITIYCDKDFHCLIDPSICCDVVSVTPNPAFYVKYTHGYRCPYELTIGDFTVCKCPIRKEIYNRYKK